MIADSGAGRDDAEDRRDRRADQIEDRLDRFSINVLGYDRASDDPKPALLLSWIRDKREREARRILRLGAIVTAGVTAILGATAWPFCQVVMKYFGH